MSEVDLPRPLGDGLVLRTATRADTEPLAEFNGRTHQQPYDTVAAVWTRDLLRGDHPAGVHDSALLVEDTATGEVVSTSCFIRQEWTYAGIPIRAGRPELIGTAHAYRNRGLVREQFETLHAWAEADSQDLQFITGIPHYYRQFGYEPALGVGSLIAQAQTLPGPTEDEASPFWLRTATPDDLAVIIPFLDQASARSLIEVKRDAADWRYELFGRSPGSDYLHAVELVETAAGVAVGLVAYVAHRDGGQLEVSRIEVAPGHSWRVVGTAILRRLRAVGEEGAEASGPFHGIQVTGDRSHPLAAAFPGIFTRRPLDFYFYIRIPDLARFVLRIGPELERRLAASALARHDGSLRLNFYRYGLDLMFAEGRLSSVERWQPDSDNYGDARFPDLTFMHLLLGNRSIADLEYAFADFRVATDEARALLTAIFPTLGSTPWPVG